MIEIESKDIFRSAYLLTCGGELKATRVTKEQQVVFVIAGNELDKRDMNYRTGGALVNPLQLRESLNLLRDLLFEKLRSEKGRKHHG